MTVSRVAIWLDTDGVARVWGEAGTADEARAEADTARREYMRDRRDVDLVTLFEGTWDEWRQSRSDAIDADANALGIKLD